MEKVFTALRNDDTSKLYLEWKQVLGVDDYGSPQVEARVVYQRVLQHFRRFVALKRASKSGSEIIIDSVNHDEEPNLVEDESEKEVIHRYAGWAVKRTRDQTVSLAKGITIKKSENDSTVTTVTIKGVFSFIFG